MDMFDMFREKLMLYLKKYKKIIALISFLSFVGAAFFLILNASAPFGSSVSLFQITKFEYAKHRLLPVTVSGGFEKAGATINAKLWTLMDRASTCFPSLEAAEKVPVTLPTIEILRYADRSGNLLAKLGKLNVNNVAVTSLLIEHKDVTVETVSFGELVDSLDQARCEYLIPYLEQDYISVDASDIESVPLVVASVYRGVRKIVVSVSHDKGVQSEIASTVSKSIIKGMRKKDAVKINLDSLGSEVVLITIEDGVSQPLAIKPAFYPELIVENIMGGGAVSSDKLDASVIGANIIPTESHNESSLIEYLDFLELKGGENNVK